MCKTTVPISYSRCHSSYPFWRSHRPCPWVVGSPCSPCWGRGSTVGPCCPHAGSHRLCSSRLRWCMGREYGRTTPPQGRCRSWCPEQRVGCGSAGWKEIAEEESSYSLMDWADQLNWGIRQPRVWEKKKTQQDFSGCHLGKCGQKPEFPCHCLSQEGLATQGDSLALGGLNPRDSSCAISVNRELLCKLDNH